MTLHYSSLCFPCFLRNKTEKSTRSALQPTNLLFALIGCILGTVIGVLPGIGPLGGTAMLIPVTFVMDPIPAIIMLSSIYYGTCYGGTITSVLMNTPGEAASVVTCLDGYQMTRKGRGGAALFIAAWGSWIGGTLTNFTTIQSRIDYLVRLEDQGAKGEFSRLPKKEAAKPRRLRPSTRVKPKALRQGNRASKGQGC
jgi:hypothetical protein